MGLKRGWPGPVERGQWTRRVGASRYLGVAVNHSREWKEAGGGFRGPRAHRRLFRAAPSVPHLHTHWQGLPLLAALHPHHPPSRLSPRPTGRDNAVKTHSTVRIKI